MSDRARAEWHATPESVRGDIHRVQSEFVKAYRYYKNAHEAFKPIAHFHKMATEHGSTLEKALTNYVGMEHTLRADPIGGLDLIVDNLGLTAPNGQRLGLRDIAYHVLTQTPDQLRAIQQQNNIGATQHHLGTLHAEVENLKKQQHYAWHHQRVSQARSVIDRYAETHPRLDELGVAIEQELKFGYDLETAYRRAELLYPATHAAQSRSTPAQTRPVDRSIHGSPANAANGARRERPREVSKSPREAVERAVSRLNGSY